MFGHAGFLTLGCSYFRSGLNKLGFHCIVAIEKKNLQKLFQELESRLQYRHLEDNQAASIAHKARIDLLTAELETKKQTELDALREKHGSRIGEQL